MEPIMGGRGSSYTSGFRSEAHAETWASSFLRKNGWSRYGRGEEAPSLSKAARRALDEATDAAYSGKEMPNRKITRKTAAEALKGARHNELLAARSFLRVNGTDYKTFERQIKAYRKTQKYFKDRS